MRQKMLNVHNSPFIFEKSDLFRFIISISHYYEYEDYRNSRVGQLVSKSHPLAALNWIDTGPRSARLLEHPIMRRMVCAEAKQQAEESQRVFETELWGGAELRSEKIEGLYFFNRTSRADELASLG